MTMSQPNEPSLAQQIHRIARVLAEDTFPTGDRAALRRMMPDGEPPPAFYRLVFRYRLPEYWSLPPDSFQDWLTIIAGIALMSPSAHVPNVGMGRALAHASYSEQRLERLLSSEGDTKRLLLLRAARFLEAKNTPFNWVDGASLLLIRDPERLQRTHARIAADFYREQNRQTATSSQS
jgi:CRISPR system Cascade subunit CasB